MLVRVLALLKALVGCVRSYCFLGPLFLLKVLSIAILNLIRHSNVNSLRDYR